MIPDYDWRFSFVNCYKQDAKRYGDHVKLSECYLRFDKTKPIFTMTTNQDGVGDLFDGIVKIIGTTTIDEEGEITLIIHQSKLIESKDDFYKFEMSPREKDGSYCVALVGFGEG